MGLGAWPTRHAGDGDYLVAGAVWGVLIAFASLPGALVGLARRAKPTG